MLTSDWPTSLLARLVTLKWSGRLNLPRDVGLLGHQDERCREMRRRGVSQVARRVTDIALSSATDRDVRAVEPVIGRLVHWEGWRHHHLKGQSVWKCLKDEKDSQFRRQRQGTKARKELSSGTSQTRQAWWESSHSQSPARRGNLSLSQTYFYWAMYFCFWRISLGQNKYLSI